MSIAVSHRIETGIRNTSTTRKRVGRYGLIAEIPTRLRVVLVLASLQVLILGARTVAADEPEILVELDRQQVYEGQSARMSVTLSNFENPSPPELAPGKDCSLKLINQQSLDSRQVTIINGRMTEDVRRGKRFDYRVTPLKSGELRLPTPVAQVNGREIRGPETTLEVLPVPQQDTVVLEIKSDRPAVYPMQPFTVTLAVLVKALPDRLASRDPLSVQRSPPSLGLPWAFDRELPEGLTPSIDWRAWLSPMESREGGGFGINGLARDSVFSMFGEQSAIGFRPRSEKVRRRDLEGKDAEYWQYAFPRAFRASRAGRYAFGPVTLEGVFGTGIKGASLSARRPTPRPGRSRCSSRTCPSKAGRPTFAARWAGSRSRPICSLVGARWAIR
jgi:hypothetical protein